MTDFFNLEPLVMEPAPVAALPEVINQDGKLLVSSRNVAAVFKKEHYNVLRDIKAVIADASDASFTALNFEVSEYTDPTGRKLPEYLMTRDGIVLLIMGYTGAKAMAIKVAYINRFNEMEAALKAEAQASKTDATKAQYSLEDKMRAATVLFGVAGIVGNQQALALDKLYRSETGNSLLLATDTKLWAPQEKQLLTPTQLGKPLGMSARAVNSKLLALGLQVKTEAGWEATPKGLEMGAVMLDTNKQHNHGTPIRQLKWSSDVASLLS